MKISKYFVLIFAVLIIACGAPTPSYSSGEATVVNTGDMWYLPINEKGLPESNIDLIFLKIAVWQDEHPDLEIVDVDYLYMQSTYSSYTENFTYGVTLLTKEK